MQDNRRDRGVKNRLLDSLGEGKGGMISENSIETCIFSSVAQSCPTLWPHEPQYTSHPCSSPTPGVYPNSCPLSQWCHPTISSSIVPYSSCPQSFPASGSFQMNQLFASGGQNTGVSASTSVLPMNTQEWSPLGWTGWISLQSKGLSCIPVADSFWYLAKLIQLCKV